MTRFVDTNILLYAIASRPEEAQKSRRAVELLNEPDISFSVQVLQEFYVQATRPSATAPISHETAVAFIETLLRYPVQETSLQLVMDALAAKSRWQISYRDAAIIEAARCLGCDVLYTEDLQNGRDFAGVRIVNPFSAARTSEP